MPCLNDNLPHAGFDRHYVYHCAWAARVLASTRPTRHVDISSSIYFISMASAFMEVEFYDYRPPSIELDGLSVGSIDLLSLPFPDRSLLSISCMHVVEHIGLGRYGDPLDPTGDLKAMAELRRVLAKDGRLLFVVPVGKPKIMFNAHRIYSYDQIRECFSELELVEFSLIPDGPNPVGIIRGATQQMADEQNYGCGCFLFRSPSQ